MAVYWNRLDPILLTRSLIVKASCEIPRISSDARATNVLLTPAGAAIATAAQGHLHAYVQERFVGRLEPGEAATLATVFARVLREL